MLEAWRVEALRCIERPEIGIYRHQYALRGIETGEALIGTREGLEPQTGREPSVQVHLCPKG